MSALPIHPPSCELLPKECEGLQSLQLSHISHVWQSAWTIKQELKGGTLFSTERGRLMLQSLLAEVLLFIWIKTA